MLQNGGSLPI